MKKISVIVCAVMMSLCLVNVVGATTKKQDAAIVDHCDTIRESLKKVQKDDARIRVFLGGRYEMILTKFIVPLNMRLVENSLSNADLVENQNEFAEAKTVFMNDYIGYQQELESLVGMDCKSEPGKFYEQLTKVRQKRKTIRQDTMRIRSLISTHIKLVSQLKGKV
ncbi:hypothetical protein IKF87_01875 [Candidatus Saccharibacteria bacterium]|nr:hypothetical protein [Candidatus Saccharibacteria bacterium]